MQIQPYLFFDGRCEEAIEFYKKALGAEVVMLMRVKDSPEPPPPGRLPAGSENKVMHAALRIGTAEFMVSDGMCSGKPSFKGFSMSLAFTDADKAGRVFAAMTVGGKVDMPLGKTFYSPCFGMLTDRFGVQWMVIVPMHEPS